MVKTFNNKIEPSDFHKHYSFLKEPSSKWVSVRFTYPRFVKFIELETIQNYDLI